MAAKKRTTTSTNNKDAVRRPTAQSFVRDFAERQHALLQAVAAKVREGGVMVDDSPEADNYLDAVIDEWCQDSDPPLELHLEMMGVLFYWALLDEVADMLPDRQEYEDEDYREAHPTTLADVLVEVLKTARSIWGKDAT